MSLANYTAVDGPELLKLPYGFMGKSPAGFTARPWMDFIVYIYLRNAVACKCARCFGSVPGSFAAVRLW